MQTEIFGKLVWGDARLLQILLQELAIFHQNDRFAADQAAEFDAFIAEYGQQQLEREDNEDREQAGQQRNAGLLHRNGGEIGHEHGDDEFRRLHFTKLALTHDAHRENQKKIEDYGAEKGNQHEITSLAGCPNAVAFMQSAQFWGCVF